MSKPNRARSHILEDISIRRFGDALPVGWVYRVKTPDYGIDGEVEIFEEAGDSTGLSFNVQLRATDNAARADRVRLKVDELNYYRQLDLPTAVVRYCSETEALFWQWASNIRSNTEIADGQKTVTYHFREAEEWIDVTPSLIRRTLEVRRRLLNYPPSAAVPLRIDLAAIPAAERYPIDRAIARAIERSCGALVRAGDSPDHIEAFIRLEPISLAVGIDTLTGVTFDLIDPTLDDYLASILYSLARIFRRERLNRQAEALAMLLVELALPHYNDDLAFDACMALSSDLPALVKLAIVNGLHEQTGIHYPLIALTIAKAPVSDEAVRRAAMDTFSEASLNAAREVEPGRVAAAHYSIGNFYRQQRGLARAVSHYNRARRYRPAYLNTGYFLRELAGVLFLAGHYVGAVRAYREAAQLETGDPDVVFLLGDALLLAGVVAEARSCFEQACMLCAVPRLLREIKLKIMVCDYLIAAVGADTVPRQRAEASRTMRPDGFDSTDHLEYLLNHVDALHPLARFNLGITSARDGNQHAALFNFLICAFVQPHDVEAWANAAICILGMNDEDLLFCVLSVAIYHMGTDAYDRLRNDIAAQGILPERLVVLDEMAMRLFSENEGRSDDGFTLRMLDGDGFLSMIILGTGEA